MGGVSIESLKRISIIGGDSIEFARVSIELQRKISIIDEVSIETQNTISIIGGDSID
jgi:hypothetical protein